MTKKTPAPVAAEAAPAVEAPAFVPAEAEVVAGFGDLEVLTNNGPVIVDNTNVVEEVLFVPGEEVEQAALANGLVVIEYR